MGKFLNPSDLLIIALSSYAVIWAANYMLRKSGMDSFQA